MADLPYGTIYQRGYVAGQKKWTTYMERAVAAESEASRLRRALLQIADMDAAALRSDDLGRAARVARDALATLPHPALDRANAGEQQQENDRG